MYVCMYVCIYVCMYAFMFGCAISYHIIPSHPIMIISKQLQRKVLQIIKAQPYIRQFEVSKILNIPEHHNYTTHAILRKLVQLELVSFHRLRVFTKDGLSKRAYPHYFLTPKGEQVLHPGLIRRLRRFIASVLFN